MPGSLEETPHQSLLLNILRDLSSVSSYAELDWDLLIRQARSADLLGRLAYKLDSAGLLDKIPEKPRQHFIAAFTYVKKHEQVIRWEIKRIEDALQSLDIPIVYLKGAAYVLQNLPPAEGRVYADVDIMVRKQALPKVEKALYIHGWEAIKQSQYDQRYYRQWMHEIPPLRHRKRQTVIDVHHRILPETTKAQPDPELMLDNIRFLDAPGKKAVLSDVDLILHSATHLFYEGEFDHGLRDLVDLDSLFRYFGNKDDFYAGLVERAKMLGLQVPLFYAMRYCKQILFTPFPRDILQQPGIWQPSYLKRHIMDFLFLRVLTSPHYSCDRRYSRMARFLLFVRSHYLRMPLWLLVPHLLRKLFNKTENEQG